MIQNQQKFNAAATGDKFRKALVKFDNSLAQQNHT